MSEHTEITDNGISKVVAFPGHSLSDAIPQSPFEIAKSDKRVCRHHMRVRLDLHQREVSCADCYAVLDPFDYLVNNATVVQRAWANYAFVQSKVSDQQERSLVLDKEVKRLRAQVARLEAKAEQLKRGDAQVLSMPTTGSTPKDSYRGHEGARSCFSCRRRGTPAVCHSRSRRHHLRPAVKLSSPDIDEVAAAQRQHHVPARFNSQGEPDMPAALAKPLEAEASQTDA